MRPNDSQHQEDPVTAASPAATGLKGAVASAASEQLDWLAVLGGRQGIFEAVTPPLIFLGLFLATHNLLWALAGAITVSVLSAIVRLVRRQTLQQAIAGAVATLLSAGVAYYTNSSSGYFLPGIIGNFVYGGIIVLTALVRYPIIGWLWRVFMNDPQWRTRPGLLRASTITTLMWGIAYLVRAGVSLPLYLAEQTGPLGIFRIATGIPLVALLIYVTWLLLRPISRAYKRETHGEVVAPDKHSSAG